MGQYNGYRRLPKFSGRFTRLSVYILLLASAVCVSFAEGQSAAPEVSASGYLTSRSITKDELLGFAINIRNKTSFSVTGFHFGKPPDGYKFDGVWVLGPQQTQTYFSKFAPDTDLLASPLSPGQNFTVWGYLRPTGVHKTSTLLLPLSWTLPANTSGSPTSVPVNLGENQVRTWCEAQGFPDLTKILAVPLLLAIITALVTFALNLLAKNKEQREAERQQKLETARKSEEEERGRKLAAEEQKKEGDRAAAEKQKDLARAEAERDAAVRVEIWKQMLPISHRYAARYYLPLSTAAERLALNLASWQTSPLVATQKVAFFYLLFLGKRLTVTRYKIGGFYFKDLRGEILASECWKKQRYVLLGRESSRFHQAVRASIDLLRTRETYQTFQDRYEDTTAATVAYTDDNLQQAWDLFQRWLDRKSRVDYVVQHLQGLFAILDYESNRPYEYWYDVAARLRLTSRLENRLRKLAARNGYTPSEIDQYFEKVQRTNK